MFDIGFWELVILFGLGLLVLGPERLPRVATQIGNWAGQARRMARTLTNQIRDELDIDVNRPFDTGYRSNASQAKSWNRPGVDDLKPGTEDTGSDDAEEPGPSPGTKEAGKPDPD